MVFLHRKCAGDFALFTDYIELVYTSPPSNSDFPGGEGESRFLNRGGQEHIQGETGRRALGFKKFDTPEDVSVGETQAVLEANRILFPEASEL